MKKNNSIIEMKNVTLCYKEDKQAWYLGRRKVRRIYIKKPALDLQDMSNDNFELLEGSYGVCSLPMDLELTFDFIPAFKESKYDDIENYFQEESPYENHNILNEDILYLNGFANKFIKTGNTQLSNGYGWTDSLNKYLSEEYKLQLGNKEILFWCYHVSKFENENKKQIQDFINLLKNKNVYLGHEEDYVKLFETLYDRDDLNFKIVDNRITKGQRVIDSI